MPGFLCPGTGLNSGPIDRLGVRCMFGLGCGVESKSFFSDTLSLRCL